MKDKQYKNLIYFQNGSIGNFLMVIFFLENIHLNDNSIILNVTVPRNKKLLSQLLEKYPYINFIQANRRSLKGVLGVLSLFRFSFSNNLVITSGLLLFYTKIMAKLIVLHPRSELVGFDDGQKINKFIYTKLLNYNTKMIYPEFLKTVIRKLGFKVKKEIPKLKYKTDENILQELNLEKNKYVILHAFGSSKSRSLKENEIIRLIKKIKKFVPYLQIVLTGGQKDKMILDEISTQIDNQIIVLITPKISKLCVVIDNAKLFIGVDTGTTHIASFLHKKSLVIAHPATTPNWLPYYNPNATILYSVENCPHNIYEGREHLEKCRGERSRCLGYVPMEIIENYLEKILR